MLNRQNYLEVKTFLKYSHEVLGYSPQQVFEDFERLKIMLLWAGPKPFTLAYTVKIRFVDYLFQKGEGNIDLDEIQNVMNTIQRFLLWMKAMFSEEFQTTSLEWIMSITEIPERKEKII